MANAFDLVAVGGEEKAAESAVLTKGTRQRLRVAAGGSKGSQSFGSGQRRRRSYELGPHDVEDLQNLWGLRDSSIGLRSTHGAIQTRLLRAPPRESVRGYVVDELERVGGRAPEAKILAIVSSDNEVTKSEIRRAISLLCQAGRLVRVPIDKPWRDELHAGKSQPTSFGGIKISDIPLLLGKERTAHDGQEHRLSDAERAWTGWDLRLVDDGEREDDGLSEAEGKELRERGDIRMTTVRAATASASRVRLQRRLQAKQRRWQQQDERLEAQLHRIEVHETPSSYHATTDGHDGLSERQQLSIERAMNVLALIGLTDRLVLRRYYVDRPGALLPTHWKHAGDTLLCLAEFTERVQLAATLARAPTPLTVLASREDDEPWLDKVRDDCRELVEGSSKKYREARAAMGRARDCG